MNNRYPATRRYLELIIWQRDNLPLIEPKRLFIAQLAELCDNDSEDFYGALIDDPAEDLRASWIAAVEQAYANAYHELAGDTIHQLAIPVIVQLHQSHADLLSTRHFTEAHARLSHQLVVMTGGYGKPAAPQSDAGPDTLKSHILEAVRELGQAAPKDVRQWLESHGHLFNDHSVINSMRDMLKTGQLRQQTKRGPYTVP